MLLLLCRERNKLRIETETDTNVAVVDDDVVVVGEWVV